jgi:hypothetical protein
MDASRYRAMHPALAIKTEFSIKFGNAAFFAEGVMFINRYPHTP